MRVLAISNALPGPGRDAEGIFVWRELGGLRALDIEVQHYHSQFRRRLRTTWQEVGRLILQGRPDLVHVYGGSIGAFAVSLWCPVPLVMTFGGSELLGPAPSVPLSKCSVDIAAAMLSQIAAPHADAIVVRSPQLKARFLRARDRERAQVIPAGVDTEVFRPFDRIEARRELGWAPNVPVVLFGASRHRAIKRFDRALAAIERLAELGVAARLESCEQVPPERMVLHLNGASCLLLTSEQEGSPNIVKEAAACGCPVVSTPVGDVAEVLQDVSPSVVSAPDPASLAAALNAVIADGRRSNGPDRVKERYALAVSTRRLKALYERTLSGWRKGYRYGWRAFGGTPSMNPDAGVADWGA